MSTTTDTTTAYGFPIARAWRESYTPTDDGHGRIRFYTITLEGLEVNRKVYGEPVDISYVIAWGSPHVFVGSNPWQEPLTDSAREKVTRAAEAHMRATYEQRFGTEGDRRQALVTILSQAALDDFNQDKRRGALTYAGVRVLNDYPFTNRRSHWESLEKAAGTTLTEEEIHNVVKNTRAGAYRAHIAELSDALEALEG